MSSEASDGGDPATVQSRLEDGDVAPPAAPTIADPATFLQHLDVSGHFHRDGRVGRMYHAGMVSLREDVPTDSLHVSVDDNRVTAHVDEVSPLAVGHAGPSRYSVPRALAHNLSGIAGDLLLLLRGRQGDQRCELDCEWAAPGTTGRLLDPRTTAWSVQLEVRVAGTLDEPRLRRAIAATVRDDGARVACLEVVACAGDDALDRAREQLHETGVPVARLPPLQACLARHPAGDVLMLNLCHAAADGAGAMRVLDRIARAYAVPGESGPPLDFLAGSELPVRPTAAATPPVLRVYRAVAGRLRHRLSPPARIAPEAAAGGRGAGFHLVELTEQQTSDIERADRGAEHRDVLLAALHLAIADWNRRHGAPARGISVLVPADLRPDGWSDELIGNFTVNARVSTSRNNRRSPAAALRAIATEGARNRRTRTGIALIAALQRAGILVLWAKQSSVVLAPLTGNRLVDTAVLCSLGRRAAAPDFGADAGETLELWFSPPSRAPRNLCIGAVSVAGSLRLTLRYPRQLFGPDAAARFAACYLAHVRDVVAATRA